MDRRALIAGLIVVGLLGAAPAVRAEGDDRAPAARVAAVELALPPAEDAAAAASFVALAPGDRITAPALRRTVQRLFLTGRFRDVTIRAFPAAGPGGAPGEWVRLVVSAAPVRRVERVVVKAAPPGLVDERALAAAARLAEGDTFDEVDLAAAAGRVLELLARRGRRGAAVEASALGDERVTVELRVDVGPPTRTRTVAFGGEPGGAAGLLGRLGTRPGEILDLDVLEADLRALRAALHEGGYRRARLGAPVVTTDAEGADVLIPLDAGPRIVVAFRGQAALPGAVLERQLGFEDGAVLDGPALDAAADRLRTFYRSRGFADARVEPAELRRGDELVVVFRISEGVAYRVGEVRFEGAEQREEQRLLDELTRQLEGDTPELSDPEADHARALALSVPGARPPPAPPPPRPGRAAYDEVAWERAAERIVDGYRAAGWLEAVYLGSSVSLDATRRTVDVRLRIREGPRVRVEGIQFEGNQGISLSELAREARLAPGEPLEYERVEETRAALLRLYVGRGYAWARVEALEQVDRERNLATVRFVVEEGPRATIGRVVITGNRRTREDVIRGALEVREGEPYDPEALGRSQAALLRLGVFRAATLRLQDPDLPQETKDLGVEVAERPYATLTQSVGYSIANGPRLSLEYTRPNGLGRAVETTLRGKVNYPVDVLDQRPDVVSKTPADRIEGRADAGVRTARLQAIPFPAALRSDAVAEIVHRRAYDLRRVSGAVGLDVGITSRVGGSIQYELEVDDIRRTNVAGFTLTQADVERLRFDEGVTTLHTVRPAVTLDYRDNATHPHRGWFGAGALEWSRSLGSSRAGRPDERSLFGWLPASEVHTNLLKLSGTLSGYLPIGPNVLALSVRGGRVFPLDRDSRTIIPRRFFLGGASTMRGFAEEEMIQQDVRPLLAAEARQCATSLSDVGCTSRGQRIAGGQLPVSEGGEAFLLAKTELRLALTGSVEGGLFVDLGNVWLDPDRISLLELRPNAGVGVRVATPIGPLVLDLGFNLTPDRTINERIFAPHFTIGLF